MSIKILDCTLRDGGYYNSWDFSPSLIASYLEAMRAAQVNVVELGFRFLKNRGFKGACAYTTDSFLRTLSIPPGLEVAVMVNGADLCTDFGFEPALNKLFPEPAASTPVDLVRFACHYHELDTVLPAAGWLADRGYRVGFNLMQISDRTSDEVKQLGEMASKWPIEVLYFADSMGGMTPDDAARIIGWLRSSWDGPLGIHTHDNMGLGLANTLRAVKEGVTWLDATVTGMGRGPGNARTEELLIEAEELRGIHSNLVPLMALIRKHFGPMKQHYGWGTNPYYYLSGKYGIHPTYIQEMLGDSRYDEEDILAVIEDLGVQGGKKFNVHTLDGAREFYQGEPRGTWNPSELVQDREVLILGTGPGVAAHRPAIESYIRSARPVVFALNTQESVDPALIDVRLACHPVRLLADAERHSNLPQDLITPLSMLPDRLRAELGDKKVLDFGLGIEKGRFEFYDTHCILPRSLVIAYALAVATSGGGARVLMAGFDGYPPGDARNDEMNHLLSQFETAEAATPPLVSVTPTVYEVEEQSIYAL